MLPGAGSLREGHRTAMTFTCKDDGLMRASFELWSWEWLNGPPPSFHAKSRADEGMWSCVDRMLTRGHMEEASSRDV